MVQAQAIGGEERTARKAEYAAKVWADFRREAELVPLDLTTDPAKGWMANDAEAMFLLISAVVAWPLNDALEEGGALEFISTESSDGKSFDSFRLVVEQL